MKNVEMYLLDMFPKHMMEVKRLYANGLLNREEYNEVLETGDKVIEMVNIFEAKLRNIDAMLSLLDGTERVEYLQKEYIHYLELLIEKYVKVENVEHGYYSLLSQISRLQEKAGKRRNG